MSTLAAVAGGSVRIPDVRVRQEARPAPLHLTRRGRVVVLLLGLAILLGGTLMATRASAEGPTSAPQVERYVVAPGDTLWQIAAGVARPGEDLRDTVHRIQQLNDMSSASLIAGEEILLPLGS
jgi:hypothetical protein